MNRRLLLQAVVALTVFAIWTSIVRVGIPGSRHSVWIIQPFGKWPAEVHDVRRTSDAELSMFASYAPSDATTRGRGPIPELFGEPVVGTVVDSDDSENINGSRFTTGIGGGTVLSISAFVAGPVGEPPHDQFQLAVYSDADGAPSRRLAATPTGRLQPDAWNTLPVRVVVQPRTSYWLMYNTNGTSPSVNNLMYTRIAGNPLDNAIQSHLTARLAQQGDRITAVADLGPMVAAIILIGLVATRRRRRAGIALLGGFVLALLIAWALRETIFDLYGAAYPSGHALRASYVACAFCLVVPGRVARVAACVFVALISVATVYTGPHYSEEVIGGMLLGWAFATAATAAAGEVHVEPALDLRDRAPSPRRSNAPS